MELLKKITLNLLEDKNIYNIFPDFDNEVGLQCYRMLEEITKVVKNETLDDENCFLKIEKIIEIFEKNKISIGNRHDFG